MNIKRKIEKRILRLLQRTVGLDKPQIYGEVVVRQGDKVLAHGRNKFVGNALISLCNVFSNLCDATHAFGFLFTDNVAFAGSNLQIRLGSNTTTATTYDMVQLVTVINVAPTSFVVSRDNPSAGVYRAKFTAVWNAGIISGTVGEMGLFCRVMNTLGVNTIAGKSISSTMWSRLSSASGDFGQFTIDDTKPLSVEWRIVFQF